MNLKITVELQYTIDPAADVLLLVEAAKQADQRIVASDYRVSAGGQIVAVAGEDGIGQRTWAPAATFLQLNYEAEVALDRSPVKLATLPATPVSAMPVETIPYLLPSRYCEANKFEHFVESEFAGLSGGALAAAIAEWVGGHLTYTSGASDGDTSALTTFAERQGVCRDYAHLVVALARAGHIPARCVSAYAPGVDPPDFHAVAELWLDGGWHLIDATGMADCGEIARVAVGRDATDIAFMTVFGAARMDWQQVSVTRS